MQALLGRARSLRKRVDFESAEYRKLSEGQSPEALLPGVAVKSLQVGDLLGSVHLPGAEEFAGLTDVGIITSILTCTVIASAESLFTAAAVDRMHSGPRTRCNTELIAQGAGNTVAGVLGALPVTAVVARSSANVQAGARTRLSHTPHLRIDLTGTTHLDHACHQQITEFADERRANGTRVDLLMPGGTDSTPAAPPPHSGHRRTVVLSRPPPPPSGTRTGRRGSTTSGRSPGTHPADPGTAPPHARPPSGPTPAGAGRAGGRFPGYGLPKAAIMRFIATPFMSWPLASVELTL